MKKIIIIFFAAMVSLTAFAQRDSVKVEVFRPVTSAYTLEVGSARVTDTYLSPLKYTGLTASFGYERLQAMKFSPEDWIMQLRLNVGMDYMENPAKNVDMWGFGGNVSWGMQRRWQGVRYSGLNLSVGGSTTLNLGALYSTRNGNNPVSAKVSWTADLTCMATYSFRIKSLPVTVRYQPTLPLFGAFFSPEYDQLYYEIYKGDSEGVVHFAQPLCYFYLDNLLTADFRFGATSLRIGYHGTVTSTEAHHLVCNMATHSFVVGISGEWLSLSPGRKISEETRIISAYY